jgi:hypothetical protein
MIAFLIISAGSFLDIARNSANIVGAPTYARECPSFSFLFFLSSFFALRVWLFLSSADVSFVKYDRLVGHPAVLSADAPTLLPVVNPLILGIWNRVAVALFAVLPSFRFRVSGIA